MVSIQLKCEYNQALINTKKVKIIMPTIAYYRLLYISVHTMALKTVIPYLTLARQSNCQRTEKLTQIFFSQPHQDNWIIRLVLYNYRKVKKYNCWKISNNFVHISAMLQMQWKETATTKLLIMIMMKWDETMMMMRYVQYIKCKRQDGEKTKTKTNKQTNCKQV